MNGIDFMRSGTLDLGRRSRSGRLNRHHISFLHSDTIAPSQSGNFSNVLLNTIVIENMIIN